MDVIDLDMDDMFGPDQAIEDNRYNNEEVGARSPTIHEDEIEGKPVKVKRIVKNPLPKLDTDRLTSGKGMPALLKDFENVKFHGKGHEAEDLDMLMQVIEIWGHRMFPKLEFKDLLERVEKLGTKRPVQVCLNKIRMDMPILDSDFVSHNNEDDIEREGDTDGVFDKLKDSVELNSNSNDTILNLMQNGNESLPEIEPKNTITAEQKERMERNRLIAEQKRLARLKSEKKEPNDTPVTEDELKHTEEELFEMLDEDMEL